MSIWQYLSDDQRSVQLPLSDIRDVHVHCPAQKILHLSSGIDRTWHLPSRTYETPTARWSTDDTALIRLLHNDWAFILKQIAKLRNDALFVATSTNYGSNPYYCIRYPLTEHGPLPSLFLEHEVLSEPHTGLVIDNRANLSIQPARLTFGTDNTAVTSTGSKVPDDALAVGVS